MRKFTLKNGLGEVLNLSSKSVFMNAPANLGFKKNVTSFRYGYSSVELSEEFALPQPTGEVVLTGTNEERYEKYNDLVKFLMKKPLTLTYILPTGATFELDCDVTELNKTESSNGVMVCSIVFAGLSMWKGQQIHHQFTSTASVSNTGDVPCGADIVATGSMVNPTIKFMKNGSVYGEARFIGSFTRLHLNTNDGEESLELKEGSSILPNPLGYQDLSISNGSIYVTFVKLAKGDTTVKFESDGGFGGIVTLDIIPRHASV